MPVSSFASQSTIDVDEALVARADGQRAVALGAYIWTSPQGSYRLGMTARSAAAKMRCTSASLAARANTARPCAFATTPSIAATSAGSPSPAMTICASVPRRILGIAAASEVGALLLDHASHAHDDRYLGVERKTELLLERAAATRPVRQVLGVVSRRDGGVRGGVPDRVVDAVGDADQRLRSFAQDAIEASAALRSLDLARVGRAHGRDAVGRDDALLQQVDPAVELDPVDPERVPAETDRGQVALGEDALVGDVVDREDGARRGERRRLRGEPAQVRGYEGRGPVVAVDDVERATARDSLARELGRGTRERGEAEGVVRIVLSALAVDAGAVEQAGDVDHDEIDLGGEPPVEQGRLDLPVAEGEPQGREATREEQTLRLERRKPRQDDRHGVPQRAEGLGEGGRDIGQPPYLDEGGQLGRDEEDLHLPRSF